jgi:signal transduction histidine kinase
MTEPLIDILLVDDEARNLDALDAILSDRGYRLLRAEGADRALHLLLEHQVAAIVLDIKMPGVSGVELAKIIKGSKRFRQIPIVFLTAHLIEDHDVIAGYGAGAVDYLTKPVNPEILRHKIAVFAELFRKTRALAELNDTLEDRVQQRTAELERSEAALRATSRQKDEFLAILAHELRNPLAPLRTGLDLLMHMPAQPAAANRTLTVMNRSLDHMVRLIDDLLDVSRISRGALELKKERVDLAALIHAAVENSRSFFDQRKHVLTVEAPRAVFAHVDATRVAQILGNLLHNAAKFTPAGGKASIELSGEGGDAWIRIADTGLGIAADKLDRVFDMFSRIERTLPDSNRGLGIGLALARRLAEMHGGTLTVSSSGEGQGTSFLLTLPSGDLPDDTDAARPSVTTPRARPIQRLDVVVIEDNEDAAETLGLWLEGQGHKVRIAHTGLDGLELLLQAHPDVVLCDIGLPGLSGIEVCERVRALAKERRPVMVALSGWGMAEDRRRTQEAGFDHHLVKPVAADQLLDLLQTVQGAAGPAIHRASASVDPVTEP